MNNPNRLGASSNLSLSSSALVANALGITEEPDYGQSYRAMRPMTCNYCRRPIGIGETYGYHNIRDSFTNGADMLADGQGEICWHCLETSGIVELTRAPLFKAAFNEQGVFALAKNEHIYSFLMRPEQISYPCVVLIGDAKAQILSWRADITVGPDLIKIQHGNNRLSIRPARLKAMLAMNSTIVQKINAGLSKKANALTSVFKQMNGKESPVSNPGLRNEVLEAAETDPDIRDGLTVFLKANLGEVWAFFKCLNNFKANADLVSLQMLHDAKSRYLSKTKQEELEE